VLIEENGGPGGGQLINKINSISTSKGLEINYMAE